MRTRDYLSRARRTTVILTLFPLAWICSSCASILPGLREPPCGHRTVLGIEHSRSKKPSDCLAVCVDMVLKYYGVQMAVPDSSLPLELISLTRRLNISTPVDDEGHVLFAAVLELSPEELVAELAKGRPLIVAFRSSSRATYHSAVVSGYCMESGQFFVDDPALRKARWIHVSRLPTFYNTGKYLVLLIGLGEQ